MFIGDTRYPDLMKIAASSKPADDLVVRQVELNRLRDFLPNPDKLREHLVNTVEDITASEATLYSTRLSNKQEAPNIDDVAVVVPCFNSARFIVETLDSIVAQTGIRVQIILVDDGSTDETLHLVKEYMQKVTDSVWITLLAIPHVGNPAITRNIALYNLLAPETQYIAFMDSDDLFADTHSLNSLVNALRENPEAKASFGDLAQITAEGELSSGPRGLKKAGAQQFRWRKDQVLSWQNLATGRIGVFHLQCMAVRQGVDFIPYRPLGEDEEFYANLFRRSAEASKGTLARIVQIPKVVCHYRKHEQNMTAHSAKLRTLRDLRAFTSAPDSDLPLFFLFAQIPAEQITPYNLSEFYLRKAFRETLRRVTRRQQSVLDGIRTIARTPKVRRRDLRILPIRQLYFLIFG